jgi:hypothetical protein
MILRTMLTRICAAALRKAPPAGENCGPERPRGAQPRTWARCTYPPSLALVCSAFLSMLLLNRPAVALEVGETAPEFALMGSDGRLHRLSDYRGTTVVLAWFPKAFTGG